MRSKNKNGHKKRRDFFCHRVGRPNVKFVDSSKEHRDRKSLKRQYKAYMRITCKTRSDIFPVEWHVTKFISSHSHTLLSVEELHFLPSY